MTKPGDHVHFQLGIAFMPRIQASRRLKPALFATAAIVMGTCLALAGVEGALRAIKPKWFATMYPWPKGYYVPDPRVDYRLAKNFPPTWMTLFDGVTPNLVYTNALGMRDAPTPPAAPGQLRILCLGCSMTEGMGIRDPSQPWPRQLEARLREAMPNGPTPVVMNGGTAGYNTFQQVIHAQALQPRAQASIWLMGYLGGENGMWGRNAFGPQGQFRLRWGTIWDYNLFARVVQGRSAASRWLLERSFLWRWAVLQRTNFNAAVTSSTMAYRDFDRANLDAMRLFVAEAKAAGARPIALYLPQLPELDRQRQGKGEWAYHRPALEAFRRAGVEWIDLTGPLLEEARARVPKGQAIRQRWGVSAKDSHFSPEANAIVGAIAARALAPRLSTAKRPATALSRG
jgi:hypothetical protein